MFRIGLIDYYLDEWHAQNYPAMLREEIARQGLSIEVKMAYAYCDKEDGMSNEEWSRKQNVPLASSMDELIANCDGVMILAPSFPEKHYEMAEKALRAGKPVYMDKIFAPSEEEGRKIFNLSLEMGTPLFSSSALRFDAAFDDYRAGNGLKAEWCLTCGPNNFQIYAIHQIEMMQTVMGRAKKVKALGNDGGRNLVFDFGEGRMGQMCQMNTLPFQLSVADKTTCKHQMVGSDFFIRLVRGILSFFQTGVAPVAPENTLDALAMLTAAHKAMKDMDQWIEV